MHAGKLVFAQLTEYLPLTTFRRCVARYDGEHKIKRFTCLEQFLCLAFAQLTYRESPKVAKNVTLVGRADTKTRLFMPQFAEQNSNLE